VLTPIHRTQLLSIARTSIEAVLKGARPQVDAASLDPELTRPSGAFVSLHTHDGDLRGCIGSIQPVAPLCHAVSSNAVNAAFRDPRFYPLTPDELPRVHVEISVMSPIEVVTDVSTIEVGRDGLIISRGGRAGLLLPQVATEYGWDRETFLAQTCAKAGLPADSWRRPDCRIERFSAEVFGEV
jgi:AmmeMemoRadiSam system protein A